MPKLSFLHDLNVANPRSRGSISLAVFLAIYAISTACRAELMSFTYYSDVYINQTQTQFLPAATYPGPQPGRATFTYTTPSTPNAPIGAFSGGQLTYLPVHSDCVGGCPYSGFGRLYVAAPDFGLPQSGYSVNGITIPMSIANGSFQVIAESYLEQSVNFSVTVNGLVRRSYTVEFNGSPGQGIVEEYKQALLQYGAGLIPDAPPLPNPTSLETVQKFVKAVFAASSEAGQIFKNLNEGLSTTKEFLTQVGDIALNFFNGASGAIIGLVNSIGVGLLDPNTAVGTKIIRDSINDPNPETRGWNWDNSKRQQMNEIMEIIQNPSVVPVAPNNSQNGVSSFAFNVEKGQAVLIDPDLATGFVYRSLSGVLFASVALPYIGDEQTEYVVEILRGDDWIFSFLAKPLTEYFFDSPVEVFRVRGIRPELDISVDSPHWVTLLTFDSSGTFVGTMTEMREEGHDVPEPSIFLLFMIGALGLALAKRQRRPTT